MSREPSALSELARYLAEGESIPLPWVVAHGHNFAKLWKGSDDPEAMIKIAARVVTREELVLTAVKIADAAPYTGKAWGPSEAVEVAREWSTMSGTMSGNRPTITVVRALAADAQNEAYASSNRKDMYNKFASYAASDAVRIIFVTDPGVTAVAAGRVVGFVLNANFELPPLPKDRREAGLRDRQTRKELAGIIRSSLRGEVTLPAVVAVAKEARR